MRLSLSRCLNAAATVFALTALLACPTRAQVTTPHAFFGHTIGDDYWLPNYTQFVGYWQKIARESPRAHLDTIGFTAEGRPQLSMIVSSPENVKKLAHYRNIAKTLAYAEITEAEARALAREGKAVMWIDGGLHASEVLGANQLIETSYQFLSRNDEETLRILNDVIIVFVHANPDGMELEANWYNHEPDSSRKNYNVPRLYQKYIGHDNNRDFYISNQNETTNMNRRMYLEWFPQVIYNHHQTGPAGAVMFAPPFRDPSNYFFHPSMITGLDLVGAALHGRMVAEDKPGVVDRSMSSYSTWWNGGLRTMAYFHNMIGILTETIGNPTPQRIPFIPERQLRFADEVLPLAPLQEWHFRQSIDYSVTANRAILDLMSRYREFFLFNIWKMGHDETRWGSEDSWVVTPRIVAEVEARASAGGGVAPAELNKLFRKPENRLPRAYVIPANQPDILTAEKFLVALQKTGVIVHRATAEFRVGTTSYPKGSYVVKTAQAFRPHVLDMFEPQDHPNDFKFPGAAPTRPYDNAGWTLALQMGVHFDRILDGFDAPLLKLDPLSDRIAPTATTVATGTAGWTLSPKVNDSFHALGRFWHAGADVYRLQRPAMLNGKAYAAGTFYVPAGAKTTPVVQRAAKELGLMFEPAGDMSAIAEKVPPVRIGLWDRYGGSMPSGHLRWLLEQNELPYALVYPKELDAGKLRAKFDVLVFSENAIPVASVRANRGPGTPGGFGVPDTTTVPAEFRALLGDVTTERTMPQIKSFLEQGGRVIAIGPSSLGIAQQLGMPITNHLVERSPTGVNGTPLPNEKFYVPGSLLEVAYDTTSAATRGLDARGIVFFDNSPVMRLGPDAALRGVRPIAWFDSPSPLRSGWAWGQNYLDGGVAMAEARYGQGTVYMYGPEITFRAQPHGTFKLLFNAIVGGTRVDRTIP